jgi:hypothetical protein
MKKSSNRFTSSFLSSFVILILSTSFLVSCSDSNPVNLREEKPPVAEGPGQTKPEPTPGTSPAPENPGDDSGTLPTPPPAVSPTPTAPAGKVARIFCEATHEDSRSFYTLRSNVGSTFTMPSIVSYVDGHPAIRTKSPLPLQSNGAEVSGVLRAQEDFMSPWKIYRTSVDLVNARANLQLISNFADTSKKAQAAYDALKLENTFLAANHKRTAYFYPNSSGTYVWESLSGRNFTLPFSAESSFSPEFVGNDDYLRFDQAAANSQTLTQKFYSFDNKKTVSLPSPLESKDSQLFGYINSAKTAIFWVEGRPEGTWKLRSVGLAAGSKSVTLATLAGTPKSLVLPMVFFEQHGNVQLAYSEEESAQDRNGQVYFKTAALHLVKVNTGKVLGNQSFAYSDELKALMTTPQDYNHGLLRSLFMEPVTGKLFASIIPKGGLVSFDPDTNTWETHGMLGRLYSCLNPHWGIEE